ncbi:hypothetical protein IMSAGC011_01998 [Lachnospiraceae bacterium]|nr:hypothetical protein IMSAGC011_01998 [Lachnospiraceae bacterium]
MNSWVSKLKKGILTDLSILVLLRGSRLYPKEKIRMLSSVFRDCRYSLLFY